MTREQFFKNLMMLLFYPFGCLLWVLMCWKRKLAGAKRFFLFALFGFLSWGVAIAALSYSGTVRTTMLWASLIMYVAVAVPYAILCNRKVTEIEERQKQRTTRLLQPEQA